MLALTTSSRLNNKPKQTETLLKLIPATGKQTCLIVLRAQHSTIALATVSKILIARGNVSSNSSKPFHLLHHILEVTMESILESSLFIQIFIVLYTDHPKSIVTGIV